MRSVNKKIPVRIVILLIAGLLTAAGLKCGGFKDVKNKAVMICYECMGIG